MSGSMGHRWHTGSQLLPSRGVHFCTQARIKDWLACTAFRLKDSLYCTRPGEGLECLELKGSAGDRGPPVIPFPRDQDINHAKQCTIQLREFNPQHFTFSVTYRRQLSADVGAESLVTSMGNASAALKPAGFKFTCVCITLQFKPFLPFSR